jgi:hypothetical protein
VRAVPPGARVAAVSLRVEWRFAEKLYVFPPSGGAVAVMALKNHLALNCEIRPIDLGRGDQLTPKYVGLNPDA